MTLASFGRVEHDIYFGAGDNAANCRLEGWSFPEPDFMWTVGKCLRLRLPSPSVTGHGLLILDTARRLMADSLLTMGEIASRLGVSRTTLYRALGRARGMPIGPAIAAEPASAARAPSRKLRAAAAGKRGQG